jgi:hypothetical protein
MSNQPPTPKDPRTQRQVQGQFNWELDRAKTLEDLKRKEQERAQRGSNEKQRSS